jgi:hypothetical protein
MSAPPSGGIFLLYGITGPDGEDRDGWLRWQDRQKLIRTAYSEDEWDAMALNVRAADYPETVADWRELAEASGFADVCEFFAAPSELARLRAFSN